jgi:putative Ig domain-containing protein
MLRGTLGLRPLTAWIRLSLCATAIALLIPAAAQATKPAYLKGHSYRHGAVPFRGGSKLNSFSQSSALATSTNNLSYQGANTGAGVESGAEKVYLVFWGSQWGTQGTNGSGYATFSADSAGVAPDLQSFFAGLGTGGETWSGVLTQYCDGVATGAQTCPTSSTEHVGYPTGGALAGVWEDTSALAPSAASGHAIGVEAVNAATHFGNTTQASNANAQYVIVSPHGTNPDNYKTGGFCAWHDYTGDSTLSGGAVSSPDGALAFTNLPYIPDAGASCGQGFVNSPGTLDGVTIVEGHEYAETATDMWPAGGWIDAGGEENGDKCAWISSGQGASQDISLTTGSFAVQSTWANDFNGGAGGCEVTHPIITNGGAANTVTVTNPGNQTSTVGTSVSLQIQASDSASGQTLTYSATGLPVGLSIDSSTGLISGTPTTAGTYTTTVTAKDTTGASGSATMTWTVNTAGGGCTASQLLGNPGFETGSAPPWTTTPGVISSNGAGETAHSGSWYAWLDGYGTTHTDTLSQTVSIPSGCTNYTFSFWLHIDTAERTKTVAYDKLTVQAGTTTLATYSNLNHSSGYALKSFNLASFAGKTVTIKFTGAENSSRQTSFVIDDTALNVS